MKPDVNGSGHRAEFDARPLFVSKVGITARDRLQFAKQILLGLFLITLVIFIAYAAMPDNPAMVQIFELIKIGAFPLVTLVIAFYFPTRGK
jgi:hypothetical protein